MDTHVNGDRGIRVVVGTDDQRASFGTSFSVVARCSSSVMVSTMLAYRPYFER